MTRTYSVPRTLIHLIVGGLLAMTLLAPQSHDRSRIRRSANFSRCQQATVQLSFPSQLLKSLLCGRHDSRARYLGSR
ncbi:MAG: hypothetical protein AAF268_01865 [Cyanobacteria bacterium P01_A01_bin.3]